MGLFPLRNSVLMLVVMFGLSSVYSADAAPRTQSTPQTSQYLIDTYTAEKVVLAKKSKKSKKSKKKYRSKKRRSYPKYTPKAKGATGGKHIIKGFVGMATGVPEVAGSIFPMGGEYIMPDFMFGLGLGGGLLYWTYAEEGEDYSWNMSMMTYDAGAHYIMSLGSSLFFDGYATFGMSSASSSITVSEPAGDNVAEVSESSMTLSFGGAGYYKMDTLVFGAEARKPIFLNSNFKDFSALYLLGSVGYLF